MKQNTTDFDTIDTIQIISNLYVAFNIIFHIRLFSLLMKETKKNSNARILFLQGILSYLVMNINKEHARGIS